MFVPYNSKFCIQMNLSHYSCQTWQEIKSGIVFVSHSRNKTCYIFPVLVEYFFTWSFVGAIVARIRNGIRWFLIEFVHHCKILRKDYFPHSISFHSRCISSIRVTVSALINMRQSRWSRFEASEVHTETQSKYCHFIKSFRTKSRK